MSSGTNSLLSDWSLNASLACRTTLGTLDWWQVQAVVSNSPCRRMLLAT